MGILQKICSNIFPEEPGCYNNPYDNDETSWREESSDLESRYEPINDRPLNNNEGKGEVRICLFIDGARCSIRKEVLTKDKCSFVKLAHTVVGCVRMKDGNFTLEKCNEKIVLCFDEMTYRRIDPELKHSNELLDKINRELSKCSRKFKIDEIASGSTDKNADRDKLSEMLTEDENELALSMCSGLESNEWLLKDGILMAKPANAPAPNMIGLSKSISIKEVTAINGLKKGRRTEARLNHKTGIIKWYLRLRDADLDGDRSHIVGLEIYARQNTSVDKGTNEIIDESTNTLINCISAEVLSMAYPVAYGIKDFGERWRTHIYPIFVTEEFCKSKEHTAAELKYYLDKM